MRNTMFRAFVPALVLAASLAVSGCHSHHIDSRIENQTGGAIHLVEVDYPSASFGIDNMTPGQVYSYRFKVLGSGDLKVQYTDSTGKQIQRKGTALKDGDEGKYVIVLLPDGKVQWVPSLEDKD